MAGSGGDTAAYGPVEHPAADGSGELIVPQASLAAAVGDRPLAGIWASEGAAGGGLASAGPASRPITGPSPHEGGLAADGGAPAAQGCYRGRGDDRPGAQPRPAAGRLVFLHLDGSGHVLPQRRTPLTLGGREGGPPDGVARHHVDGPIALGIVKRNTPVDAVLDAGRGERRQNRWSSRPDRGRRWRMSTLITVAPPAPNTKADVPQLPPPSGNRRDNPLLQKRPARP